MTPKPESETDPWAKVKALAFSTTRYTAQGEKFTTMAYLAEYVDAARAAEGAQRRQEIAVKDETIRQQAEDIAYFKDFRDSVAAALCVENEQGPVDPSAIVEAADSTLSQLFDFSARLATVEAERDNQYTQAVEATQRALLAEAERDRLKAALVNVRAHTSHMPGAMRELLAGLLGSIERIVDAALTPQGQSTDGETR